MTLAMINFFNDGFHVVDKGTLLIIEITQVGSCAATLNVLIFDLSNVGFVKLF